MRMNYDKSKEAIRLLAILSLLVIPFHLISFASASDWPDCKFQCRANDVTITDLWLGDSQGNSLSPSDPGSQKKVYIWARFRNLANSPRYAAILLCDIYVNGALYESYYDEDGQCVLDTIPAGSENSFSLCSFSWISGQEVKIKRLILSWETAKGTDCSNADRRCSNRNTKCYREAGDEIDLTPPTCQIEGENIACENIISTYLPRAKGGPASDPKFIWRIDGKDADDESEEDGFQVNWGTYGSGYHLLSLTVDWNDERGSLSQSCMDNLRVLVVEVPSAVIEQKPTS